MESFLSQIYKRFNKFKFKLLHIITKFIKKNHINKAQAHNKVDDKVDNKINQINPDDFIFFCDNNNHIIKYIGKDLQNVYIRFIDNSNDDNNHSININIFYNSDIIFQLSKKYDTGYIFLSSFNKNNYITINSRLFTFKYTLNLKDIVFNEDFNTEITYFI